MLSFDAPKSGRPMLVYFAPSGKAATKFAGAGNRIAAKRWFIRDGKLLCRTAGRKNRNHCTLVRPAPGDDRILLFNKKFRYQAKILKGRRLPN